MAHDTLTLDGIVQAAVALLDEEGLEGLNMRALGARLGSAATAVYWHVGGKDELIALAADRAWHEIGLLDLDRADWRTAAAALAADVHAMLARHPWLVQAFGSVLMAGTGKARHDDHALAVFETAGFPAAQADQAAATLLMFVLGNAVGAAAVASLGRRLARGGGDAEQLIRETKKRAAQIADGFPRLRARLDTAADTGYGAAPDHSFEFGLRAILDGLEAQLARLERGPGRREGRSPGQADPRRDLDPDPGTSAASPPG